ncbi:MAG: redoxin family protein [Petrimonas sp.]
MRPKTILTLLLVAVAITACAQTNTFKITGQIDNVPDGDIVQLYTIEGRVGTLFKQDTIHNGKFTIEGETDSLQMLSFMVIGENYPMTTIFVWISPGSRTKITGKGYYLSSWSIESNVKEQQEEEIYRDAMGDLSSKSDSLLFLYYNSIDKMQQVNNESTRTESRRLSNQFDSIEFIKHQILFDVMETQPVTQNWINKLADYAGFAVNYGSTTTYPEDNIKQMQNLYNRLTDEQKQSQKGQLIYRYIFPMQIIQEGQPMANAELYDPQGKPHKIAEDFQGKYLLLDFWGVGCPPCIAAFPEMKEIYEAHSDKLTIISITTDTEKIWKEGLQRHQLPWVNLTDYLGMEGYASLYGIRGIPFYVLISPEGIVEKIWSGYGKGMLKEKLKNVLQ